MKISLEWLLSFTPGPLDATAAAAALTHGGLNVETVEGAGDEAVLDVEVTSNRGDCLSHLGVAREVAALLSRPFTPITPAAAGTEDVGRSVQVRIDAPADCPHYTARAIRGVTIRPSPPAIVRRLTACGVRPISNVVDATNYVLLEMGQPLHAFDLARLAFQDGAARIVVRHAHPGEKLTTLDGRPHDLKPWMLVIADNSRALALAGVMGGADSQVTGTTTDILLESARFDPLSIRRTSRALSLRSESSHRYERGIDPTLPLRASLRAAQLILETAGGELLAGVAQAGSENYHPKALVLRLAKLKSLLGVELPLAEVESALSRLHLSPQTIGETIEVQVPSWRLDLNIEADLIEEVIRVLGYERLPPRDEISIRLQRPAPDAGILETLRQTLVAAGFYEAVTFSFVSDALKDDFFPVGAGALCADASVRKADATLRPSLLPGLLEAVRRNETNGAGGARLFEIGSAFTANDKGGPDERRRLGLLGGADWRDLRGVVESLLEKLDPGKKVRFVPAPHAGFARGACASVQWDGKPIGHAGLIDRKTADKLSLRQVPMAAELNLPDLIAGAVLVARPAPLAQFPPARRDLSLVVDEKLPYERIESCLRSALPPYLESIDYVTTFRGKPLEQTRKSVTVTLVFRGESATLTGEEVDSAVAAAAAAAAKELGAVMR